MRFNPYYVPPIPVTPEEEEEEDVIDFRPYHQAYFDARSFGAMAIYHYVDPNGVC